MEAAVMKGRPILMSAPMVRAILDGRKTVTRRVVKPQPESGSDLRYLIPMPNAIGACAHFANIDARGVHSDELTVHCPYGMRGDRLWVRETWQHSNYPLGPYDESCIVFYRADYMDDPHGPDGELSPEGAYRKWRPSIHMPRAASRITLEITDVRVERLQDISEADALAEGCALECMTPTGDDSGSAIHGPGGFRALWSSINGAESWDQNPWVWVVEFRRCAE